MAYVGIVVFVIGVLVGILLIRRLPARRAGVGWFGVSVGSTSSSNNDNDNEQ